MFRYILISFLFLPFFSPGQAQPVLTKEEAVGLAVRNRPNLDPARLAVQQQQQLSRGAAGLESPQLQAELTPFEPLAVGVQQTLSLPGVYRSRRALQSERIRLAQLQLQGAQIDLVREVRISFLQLQYLQEMHRLLTYQDSVYQAIKTSARRFFEAGQINKLEELTATTQADRVRNDLQRNEADLAAEKQIFLFLTNETGAFRPETLQPYPYVRSGDTSVTNPQQLVLQQQVTIGQRSLQAERAGLLPEITTGVSFPATREYERPVGFQLGLTLPIWQRQNRSRIAAARTAVEMARAQQALEQQRLNARYRQAQASYSRELQSLQYFQTIALPQARAIMDVSQRLFAGGELNYIESLRNLSTAFTIQTDHLETLRAYNTAVIELLYLNGTL